MKAMTGVLPSSPQVKEIVLAEDQPEYLPLPVAHVQYLGGEQALISRYRLTWLERLRVLFTGSIWIEQMTAGQLQPQRPTVYEPLTKADMEYSQRIDMEHRQSLA